MNDAVVELKTAQNTSQSGPSGKFREFCAETTAHGFGRLASSSSPLEKFIWSVCLLAALSYMTYQGAILVSDFVSYPVDVKVELRYRHTIEFPTVVVCNMNSVRRSGVNDAIEQRLMVSIYLNCHDGHVLQIINPCLGKY